LLCSSENGDIAWCNKDNSERGFCFLIKIIFVDKNKNLFLFIKTKKFGFKKIDGLFFLEKRGFLNSD